MLCKKLFLLLLVVSIFPIEIYAQNLNTLDFKGYAVYKAGCDSALVEGQIQRVKKKNPEHYALAAGHMRSANDLLSIKPLELFFDQRKSLFRAAPLVEDYAGDPMVELVANILAQTESPIFVNKEKQLRFREVTLDEGVSYYHVVDEYHFVNWEISSEKKQIGRYSCHFAKGSFVKNTHCCGPKEIPVAAWFAPEIPVPFGPANFGNLPGLVIQVSVGDPKDQAPVVYSLETIVIGENAYKDFPKQYKPKETLTQAEFEAKLNLITGLKGN